MSGSYGHNSGEAPRPRITAELVRAEPRRVDIKLVIDGQLHLLAWRRHAFRDDVLMNNVVQRHTSSRRETVYGLVFGKSPEGEGGERLLLTIDPKPDWNSMDWTGETRIRGVRLESAENLLVSYGSLDPRALRAPTTFTEWLKKSMGIMPRS